MIIYALGKMLIAVVSFMLSTVAVVINPIINAFHSLVSELQSMPGVAFASSLIDKSVGWTFLYDTISTVIFVSLLIRVIKYLIEVFKV